MRWLDLTPTGDGWLLTAERAGVEAQVLIAPASGSPAFCRVGGLQLAYRAAPSLNQRQLAVEACEWLASRLAAQGVDSAWSYSSYEFRDWVPPPQGLGPPLPLSSLPAREAPIRRDAHTYAYFFGAVATYHLGDDCYSLRYPKADDPHQPAQYRVPPEILRRRALRSYIEALGFGWESDRYIRTVPTPNTLNALAARQGVNAGFKSKVVRMPLGRWLWFADWLEFLLDGVFPLQIAHPLGYWDDRVLYRLSGRRLGRTDCGMLAHDMATHLLWLHRVPSEWIAEFAIRVRRALPPWLRRLQPPEAVVSFYEDTLTHACQELWRESEDPADFDLRLAAARTHLIEQLDEAIAKERGRTLARSLTANRARA